MTKSKNAVFSFLQRHWLVLLPPLLICLACLFSPLFLPVICSVAWPILWLGMTIIVTALTLGICQLIRKVICDARQKKISEEAGKVDLDESMSERELSKIIPLEELIKKAETKNDSLMYRQFEARTKQALEKMEAAHSVYYQHLAAYCLNPSGVTLVKKNIHWRVYGEWYGLLNEEEELKPGVIEIVKEKLKEKNLPKPCPIDDILSDDNKITFPSLQF